MDDGRIKEQTRKFAKKVYDVNSDILSDMIDYSVNYALTETTDFEFLNSDDVELLTGHLMTGIDKWVNKQRYGEIEITDDE